MVVLRVAVDHYIMFFHKGFMKLKSGQILRNNVGNEQMNSIHGHRYNGHSYSQLAISTLPQNLRDICGIVLFDKTAYFKVVFYYEEPKTHLRCNHEARLSILIWHTWQVNGLSWQRTNLWMDFCCLYIFVEYMIHQSTVCGLSWQCRFGLTCW